MFSQDVDGMKKSSIYAGIGFGLFCLGHMLINEQILVQAILYRAAASDYHSALIAFTAMALQATALLIGLIVLPNRLFWLIVILIGISAVTNLIFSQILNDIVDLPKFDWLLTESRHAKNAAGQFLMPAAIGLAKTLLALGLFVTCRELFRLCLRGQSRLLDSQHANVSAILLIVFPSFAFGLGVPGAIAAERNIYNFAYEKLTIPSLPQRRVVAISAPNINKSIEKIIWIIDESVG
jgi:hypothetical protein